MGLEHDVLDHGSDHVRSQLLLGNSEGYDLENLSYQHVEFSKFGLWGLLRVDVLELFNSLLEGEIFNRKLTELLLLELFDTYQLKLFKEPSIC